MIDDPDFAVVNVAVGGATVVSPNLVFESDATMQMQQVLAHQPDAVVLSFGTNDVFQGRTSTEINAAYAQEAVALAAGVEVFVATTPPLNDCGGPTCPLVMTSNALLRASFADRIVEFFDDFTPQYFEADGYHERRGPGAARRASVCGAREPARLRGAERRCPTRSCVASSRLMTADPISTLPGWTSRSSIPADPSTSSTSANCRAC